MISNSSELKYIAVAAAVAATNEVLVMHWCILLYIALVYSILSILLSTWQIIVKLPHNAQVIALENFRTTKSTLAWSWWWWWWSSNVALNIIMLGITVRLHIHYYDGHRYACLLLYLISTIHELPVDDVPAIAASLCCWRVYVVEIADWQLAIGDWRLSACPSTS